MTETDCYCGGGGGGWRLVGGDLVESETPKREFYQLSDEITGKYNSPFY